MVKFFLMKKMLKDIRDQWAQFLSVFIMSLISVLIFSGMAAVWTGLNEKSGEYVEATDMADIWVSATSIDDDDLKLMEGIGGVNEITRSMSMNISVSGSDSELQINTYDKNIVSRPFILEGAQYNPEEDGIWIDYEYAKEYGLTTGDEISLTGISGDTNTEIKGIIMNPENIYYTGIITETVPNYKKYGYAFVGTETMKDLFETIIYSRAKIKAETIPEKSAFETILGDRFICLQDRSEYTSFARVEQESSQMKKMALLFSAVFILLSLLTMYTSMVRLVKHQKLTIGTLKALGMSSSLIRFHYCLYGLIIPAAGGITGLLLGKITVARLLLKVKQTTLYMPEWRLVHSKASFALIAIVVLACVIASVWAAGRCLKGMPVEIMRNTDDEFSEAGKVGEGSESENYTRTWILRNIAKNKVRFIMGIVGVAGGIMLIIAGLGVRHSINYSNSFCFEKQFNYDSKAILKIPGVLPDEDWNIQSLQESSIEIKTQDGDVKQSLITVCDEGDLIKFYDDSDNIISLPSENAVISRKLAADMGVRPGDTINVRVFGEQGWLSLKVAETSKTLSPQGIFMSKGAYEKTGYEFKPTAILVKGANESEISANAAVKNTITKEQQVDNTDTVSQSVMSIVRLLIAASVVLSVVILYNLGVLGYVERVRDYATMKVLGFYHSEIRRAAIGECLISTLLGWAAGIPLGIFFLKLYIKIISFDTFEWVAKPDIGILIISSIVIVGVSLAVNLILSGRVKRIVMTEALKSVE